MELRQLAMMCSKLRMRGCDVEVSAKSGGRAKAKERSSPEHQTRWPSQDVLRRYEIGCSIMIPATSAQ